MVKGDSKATLISLIVIISATVFGYTNSLFEPATLMMLSYGSVTLLGGLIHQLSGEWGVLNLIIAFFGIIIVLLYFLIDIVARSGALTSSTQTFIYTFWYGFTGIMTGGLAIFILRIQLGDNT